VALATERDPSAVRKPCQSGAARQRWGARSAKPCMGIRRFGRGVAPTYLVCRGRAPTRRVVGEQARRSLACQDAAWRTGGARTVGLDKYREPGTMRTVSPHNSSLFLAETRVGDWLLPCDCHGRRASMSLRGSLSSDSNGRQMLDGEENGDLIRASPRTTRVVFSWIMWFCAGWALMIVLRCYHS
jgi:hypothetical protein